MVLIGGVGRCVALRCAVEGAYCVSNVRLRVRVLRLRLGRMVSQWALTPVPFTQRIGAYADLHLQLRAQYNRPPSTNPIHQPDPLRGLTSNITFPAFGYTPPAPSL